MTCETSRTETDFVCQALNVLGGPRQFFSPCLTMIRSKSACLQPTRASQYISLRDGLSRAIRFLLLTCNTSHKYSNYRYYKYILFLYSSFALQSILEFGTNHRVEPFLMKKVWASEDTLGREKERESSLGLAFFHSYV